ncbi:hypothetical protein PG984_002770 [Apiospora sp. TS-2023a]
MDQDKSRLIIEEAKLKYAVSGLKGNILAPTNSVARAVEEEAPFERWQYHSLSQLMRDIAAVYVAVDTKKTTDVGP